MASLMLYSKAMISLYFLFHNFSAAREKSLYFTKLEDLITDFVNDTYIDEGTFDLEVVYHSNSDNNAISIHVDLIKELPPSVFLKMTLWGRAIGQYIVPTGLSININICAEKSQNSFLNTIREICGFGLANCPPKPGTYIKKDFLTDLPGLPYVPLPDLHILIDVHLYGLPDISLVKARAFFIIS